jgi:hypothetical protein
MAKPGPAKGKGGAPRKAASRVATRGDGYKRVTTGAKGKGTQVYAHRAAAGLGGTKGSKSGKTGGVVDHKNRKRGDNRKSNLRVTSKRGNNQNKG